MFLLNSILASPSFQKAILSPALAVPAATCLLIFGLNCCRRSSPPRYLLSDSSRVDPMAKYQWGRLLSWVASSRTDKILSAVDKNGQTALHHACLYGAPTDVIGTMLKTAPELAFARNKDGELAIHWSIRLSCNFEDMIQLLLEANPTSGFVQDNSGNTPLSLLWERNRGEIRKAWREGGLAALESLHSWKRIMLLFRSHHNHHSASAVAADNDETATTFRPLHTAAKCPCPPDFFAFMMQVFSDGIRELDEHGRYPLHAAASCSDHADTKIRALLAEYPQAASVADASGKLPFSIALEAGVAWEQGTQQLFRAEPRASMVRDRDSFLLPFMLAAAPLVDDDDDEMAAEDNDVINADVLDADEDDERRLSLIFSALRTDPERIRDSLTEETTEN